MASRAFHLIQRCFGPGTVCALLVCMALPATAAELDIHEVKARYIHNFIKYVTWPGPASESKSFNIAILAAPPLKSALEQVSAKSAQAKSIQIFSEESLASHTNLNVIYVRETNRERIGEILKAAPKSALTIGEGPSFLARGGMIEFNLSEGKIRFSVNLLALREAGFSVDAKLLTVAQEVRK